MSLGQRLSEIDQQLDALGAVPADLAERVRLSVSGSTLEAMDQELEALSTGMSFVVARSVPPPSAPPSAFVPSTPSMSAPPSMPVPSVPEPSWLASSAPSLPALPSMPMLSEPPSAVVELSAGPSFAPLADLSSIDAPFVPTLPSEPPPGFETTVGHGSKARTLSMSEPPMSQPPPAYSDAPAADLDPFEGKPAPIPVPQRTPSMWPVAPAPKRTTSRTIRTSIAPPPPLPPPGASMRPRSIRPSDTPDPFAPLNRASSRPPAKLDGDQLFGGISSAPPGPRVPSRAPESASATQRPSAAADGAETDDFELLVDDEMIEIDVDEE